ncbi:rho GTPase-activating protein 30 isoform X2 [Thalassophryne amazonica]|uniref:rho GTPase-activating protein 30 isoform X2 n=1 Tax=Thalassophryne amazonica TaxID=390379 RepID=UPI001470EE0F|nr:rho GTPase-activating protein 30 isoform X2 [Thalassophryne amazonica]
MRRVRRKGGSKEKVFGCDLIEHLTASSQEIPLVLRCCSEFVEHNGIVDGIYRLSGVSSNIQKLRNEFENDGTPDLNKDVYLQDIHCISSLCKAYFRELPNPLLTYQLYDKFAEAVAIQLEEERLVKIRDVLKELPAPHYRTLEFLMRHLIRMASYSSETNMHARNLAIVWAPNLLRSKDIEASGFNGTAAFMEVRVQSIVVEFILTHVPQLFPKQGVSSERRQSLPSPSAISNQEEGFFKPIPSHPIANFGNISPGDGPLPIRPYHAIIEGTDKRKGSLKGRKWMSIFNIGGRFHDPRRRNKHSAKDKDRPPLRPARSMDSLSTQSFPKEGSRQPIQRPPSTHMSPLVIPSTQSGTEVGISAGSLGGSGYAVTYRRGTGIVSGGVGTQGTYQSLDPEGLAGSEVQPLQTRSPGLSTKVSRRAAMHITGPTMVTVPLHITSNLALGVLQGGGSDRVIPCGQDKDGSNKEEGEKLAVKEKKMSRGTCGREKDKSRSRNVKHDEEGGEVKYSEAAVDGGSDGKDERMKVEKKNDEEVRAREQTEGVDQRAKSGTSDQNDDRDDEHLDSVDEYMDMKRLEPVPAGVLRLEETVFGNDGERETSDVYNNAGVEEDDQELCGYVQDNFDFLDHMDCSVSYHMNEFSVEPPGHSDDEYEVMEQSPQSTAELDPPLSPQTRPDPETDPHIQTHLSPHRRLSADAHHRHSKSLSLPYRTPPSLMPQESTSEDEVIDDNSDDEYSSDEEESMFIKSLPLDYFLTWARPEAEEEDRCTSPRVVADQLQSSEEREHLLLHSEPSACKEAPTGLQEKGKEEHEERLEVTERLSTKKEDEGEQPENKKQSTSTEDNLHVAHIVMVEDAENAEEEPPSCCTAAFPLQNNEDIDHSRMLADMKVEDERDTFDDPNCGGKNLAGDPKGEVNFPVLVAAADFHTQKEVADVEAEDTKNLCIKSEEDSTMRQRIEDVEWEDMCQNGECSRPEMDVDADIILSIEQNMWEEPGEGRGEDLTDKNHEEKEEEAVIEQENALYGTSSEIWDELEDVICEIIEDEESNQAERERVALEEGRIKDVLQAGEEEEWVESMECLLSQDAKVRGEETEEEATITTGDKPEIMEEVMEMDKNISKMQLELEDKEENIPKRSETDQEKLVIDENEQHPKGEVLEKDKNISESTDEQTGTRQDVDENRKHQQEKDPNQDPKEVKGSRKCDETDGGQGVGRKLVISRQSPVKVYQVKAVPVVPPKPQHCKITALSIRQQQQRDRQENPPKILAFQERVCTGEPGEDEVSSKRERQVLRGGDKKRDGDDGAARDATRNSPFSMCFDEAVAIATLRREREKESEKERERQREWGYEV